MTTEWRKHRITGDWYSIEYRHTDEDGNVGNWRRVAHAASEKVADCILSQCEAGTLPVEAVIKAMINDRV